MRVLFGLWIAVLAFVAVPASAQQDVENPPDPWVHAATGAAFPAVVGEFQRMRVVEYSDDGRDASAGYNLRRGNSQLTVTLYVYPTIPGFDCAATYEDAKRAIENYKGATLLNERLQPAPSGIGANVAPYAAYLIPAGAMREDIPEVRSDLYLYCPPGDQWLVKYRATWSSDANFEGYADTLLRAIRWPGNLGG